MRKVLFFLLIAACNKDAATTATKEAPPAPSAENASPVASATTPAPPTSAPPEAPVPIPSVATKGLPSPTPAPTSAKVIASATAIATPPPIPRAAATRITGSHFTLDVASPGCVTASTCVVTVRLEANGGFHINKDYPYKLALNPAPSIEFLGSDPAATSSFSKSAGDFVINEEHVATMTVRFKPTAPGIPNLSGTYKMSVCSESNCQLEQMKIALDVPVEPVR